MDGAAVNRWAVSLLYTALQWGCHLGRPEALHPYHVGRVEVPMVEPGLGDDLSRGLSSALAGRGALGEGRRVIDLRVIEVAEGVVAVDATGARVHRVHLVVSVTAGGPIPAVLVWRGERGYAISESDPTGAEAARATAFQALSEQLGRDAVTWLLDRPPLSLGAPSSSSAKWPEGPTAPIGPSARIGGRP